MREEYRAKVFRSGNSLALRLPKALGAVEGTEMRILREEQAGFTVEPIEQPKRKFDVDKVCGSAHSLKPIADADRLFEHSPRPWDDPDWPGWASVRE